MSQAPGSKKVTVFDHIIRSYGRYEAIHNVLDTDISYTLCYKFPPVGFQEVPGKFESFRVFTDADEQRWQVLCFYYLSFDASFPKPRQNEKAKDIIEQV